MRVPAPWRHVALVEGPTRCICRESDCFPHTRFSTHVQSSDRLYDIMIYIYIMISYMPGKPHILYLSFLDFGDLNLDMACGFMDHA